MKSLYTVLIFPSLIHAVTVPLLSAPYVNLSDHTIRGSGMARYQTTAGGGQMPTMGGGIKTCYLINLSIQGNTVSMNSGLRVSPETSL